MSAVLAQSEYIEVRRYENTDLPFLLNITTFDDKLMRWIAVARVRGNKYRWKLTQGHLYH